MRDTFYCYLFKNLVQFLTQQTSPWNAGHNLPSIAFPIIYCLSFCGPPHSFDWISLTHYQIYFSFIWSAFCVLFVTLFILIKN